MAIFMAIFMVSLNIRASLLKDEKGNRGLRRLELEVRVGYVLLYLPTIRSFDGDRALAKMARSSNGIADPRPRDQGLAIKRGHILYFQSGRQI
jgi:hypothetical protein